MKRILITGAGSYIGTSVRNWLAQYPGRYQTEEVDMKDGSWKHKNFSGYDVVLHVAGLAHADVGRVSEETQKTYYEVNRDLAVDTAKKAKEEGIRQFIFMSSIIVYGSSGHIGERKVITRKTIPAPENFYGESKLQAEKGILPLADESFVVTVLRPPMIYGKGSRGNYQVLEKLARRLPVFPDIKNERSMLYIGNLCEFIRVVIDTEQGGILLPQNQEYIRTTEMVRLIAECQGKKIWVSRVFNGVIVLLGKTPGRYGQMVNKAFGNLVYEQDTESDLKGYVQIWSMESSIEHTVARN